MYMYVCVCVYREREFGTKLKFNGTSTSEMVILMQFSLVPVPPHQTLPQKVPSLQHPLFFIASIIYAFMATKTLGPWLICF